MKNSRIIVLALCGIAVLCVSAAMAAPFAAADEMGQSDMMKDGTFPHHGACDDKIHLPCGREQKKGQSLRKFAVTVIGTTVAE